MSNLSCPLSLSFATSSLLSSRVAANVSLVCTNGGHTGENADPFIGNGLPTGNTSFWNDSVMMASSIGNILRITGPLCREFTGHSLTKASGAGLWCFLWSACWTNGWVNNRNAGDLRRYRAHYDVTVIVEPTKRHTVRVFLCLHLVYIRCFQYICFALFLI